MTLAERLDAGLSELSLDLLPAARVRLLDYLGLIAKWNRVHNLTAIREPEQMIAQHLLDSLAILPAVHGATLLDVGTGAGLPGIPLAVARPGLAVTLLDSNQKKISFLRQVKGELALANVEVAGGRVEAFRPAAGFDIVVSRAFAELAEFAALAGHLVAAGGRMLAMKGICPTREIARLPVGFAVDSVLPLRVPQLGAERHLVILRRTA